MAGRTRSDSDAAWLTSRQLLDMGREIRVARIAAGYRLVDTAQRVGMSASHLSRVERGMHRSVTYEQLASIAAAVGLKLYIRAFPARRRLLDKPQLALYERLSSRAHPAFAWKTEVPMPIEGDLRAADVVGEIPGCRIVVELIAKLSNYQHQARAGQLKQRDLGADRLILVLYASRSNREAVREAGPAADAAFPLRTREVMEALAEGRDPGANGIVFL
jgi:transcriptional regulator with XRE-family HTH domain